MEPRAKVLGDEVRPAAVEDDPVREDAARQSAPRALDVQPAGASRLGLRHGPAQPRLAGEEPYPAEDERQDDEQQRGEERPYLQKLYPTEKCRRNSPVCSPYAISARTGPIGVRKRPPTP